MEMYQVWLVSLPLLSMHPDDFLYNTVRGDFIEPHLDPCSATHYIVSWSVIETFLKFNIHLTHFHHFIGKLDIEHVWDDQLVHLD